MKTITFLLMYYLPEEPTVNFIYQKHIDECLNKGMRVNIITPNPTRGVSKEQINKYRHIKYEHLRTNLHVYRVNCFTYYHFNKFNLLHRYLSVSYRCAQKLKKIPSDEIFIQTSPPIFYAYWASKIAKKRGIKIIYDIQDIYPDNIFSHRPFIYKFVNNYQKKIMQRADDIYTISEDMRLTLANKGDFSKKIHVRANPPTFQISRYDDQKMQLIKQKYHFENDKKTILYAGNIGYLQDLDVLLAVARILQDENHIAFKIIGEGSQAIRIKAKIAELNLQNCEFYPMTTNEESAYLYKAADVNFISLLPGVIYTACPLKTAMIKQAGQPVIACVDRDSNYASELLENGAISIIPNRDYHLLADVIKDYFVK
ncbi:MAG TPA: glycosyltransferase family 4 protein [Bacilli bacterium]|nr:glycosyltransferase family 4 protein [Bacilli bacterium]